MQVVLGSGKSLSLEVSFIVTCESWLLSLSPCQDASIWTAMHMELSSYVDAAATLLSLKSCTIQVVLVPSPAPISCMLCSNGTHLMHALYHGPTSCMRLFGNHSPHACSVPCTHLARTSYMLRSSHPINSFNG
jgi:hypothetical protein